MSVKMRILAIRLSEKIQKDSDYAKQLGVSVNIRPEIKNEEVKGTTD